MDIFALFAALGATLAFGAWLVVREEPTDQLYRLRVEPPPPFGCSADGARADSLPRVGAGPTPKLPAPVALPGRSEPPASGDPT